MCSIDKRIEFYFKLFYSSQPAIVCALDRECRTEFSLNLVSLKYYPSLTHLNILLMNEFNE